MSRPSLQLVFPYKTERHVGSFAFSGPCQQLEVDMGQLRPSFFFLLLLGFLCVANSNPISGLFGKSDDAKATEEGKDVKEPSVTTTTTTAATPTGATSASCSGLSGFFHLCDKTEQTEPPKKVKRDAGEEEDSDSDSDSDSDEDEGKNEATTSSTSEVEVEKRQVGDPEAPVLGEVPPVLEDAMRTPETSEEQEEEGSVKRRQVEDSDEQEEENVTEKASRRRRDCRDDGGDYWKDCRKKREYVPACFGTHCIKKPTEAPEKTETD